MPNIKGTDGILLQPGTTATTRTFEVPVKTTTTDKKGFLAPGVTMTNVVVTATKSDGTDATSDLIVSQTYDTTSYTVVLKYPTTLGDGRYRLKALVTMSNSDIEPILGDRVIAKTF